MWFYTLSGCLASLKIIPLVAPVILSAFYSIGSDDALKLSLNCRNQMDVSSWQDFSKNPYTFTYFCRHTAIYSFSNGYVCCDFAVFVYNKEFFTFCKVSSNYLTNSVEHLIFGGNLWFGNHVIYMKCKQSNDVSILAQKKLNKSRTCGAWILHKYRGSQCIDWFESLLNKAIFK